MCWTSLPPDLHTPCPTCLKSSFAAAPTSYGPTAARFVPLSWLTPEQISTKEEAGDGDTDRREGHFALNRARLLLGSIDHLNSLDTHEVGELARLEVVLIWHVGERLLAAAHGLEHRDADARAVE